MRRPSSKQRRLVILTLAIVTFGIAYYAGVSHETSFRDEPAIHGVTITPPTPVPPFALTDHRGELYNEERLADHWSLLMLDPSGTTNPSPALIQLLQVHNRMAIHSELQRSIHYLYLAKYREAALDESVSRLGDNIHGLQGDHRNIDETLLSFGVDTPDSDPVLYLIGPRGRLHALFTQAEDAATIAEDLTKLITSKQ